VLAVVKVNRKRKDDLNVGRPDFTCCVVQSSQELVASIGVTARGFQCSAMNRKGLFTPNASTSVDGRRRAWPHCWEARLHVLCSSIFTRASSLKRSDRSRVPVFSYASVKAYSHQAHLRPSTGVDALDVNLQAF